MISVVVLCEWCLSMMLLLYDCRMMIVGVLCDHWLIAVLSLCYNCVSSVCIVWSSCE